MLMAKPDSPFPLLLLFVCFSKIFRAGRKIEEPKDGALFPLTGNKLRELPPLRLRQTRSANLDASVVQRCAVEHRGRGAWGGSALAWGILTEESPGLLFLGPLLTGQPPGGGSLSPDPRPPRTEGDEMPSVWSAILSGKLRRCNHGILEPALKVSSFKKEGHLPCLCKYTPCPSLVSLADAPLSRLCPSPARPTPARVGKTGPLWTPNSPVTPQRLSH